MESMPPNRLSSSWVVRATAGEPVAVVRVRNLQTTVRAARDAWNRANKRQPLLVSAELSFAQSFSSASENDTLGSDTVHYGNLSKAILAAVAVADTDDRELKWLEESLGGVLETIWASLTGSTINGSPSNAAQRGERAFLDTTKLRFMSVTASLPKATLLGDGVSLTASSVFNTGRPTSPVHLYGICMCLHRLRVPTLIGVNSNERHSKQAVFADIKIDKVDLPPDFYPAVEGVVVKTMEESSFETLEALGAELANKIAAQVQAHILLSGSHIRIRLEKPAAIPLAEGPVIEILVIPNSAK